MPVPDLLRQDVDEADAVVDRALVDRVGRQKPVDVVGAQVGDHLRRRHRADLDVLIGIEPGLGDVCIEQRVHACMVPVGTPIAHVEGVFNAVVTEGDFVGQNVRRARAGAGPTASAVVADLIDIARGRTLPTFSVPAAQLKRLRLPRWSATAAPTMCG